MIRAKFFILFFIAMFPIPSTCYSLENLSYDNLYDNSENFRKSDSRLNTVYKELMEKLNWQEKRVLLDEQRKWHNKLFPIMVENKTEGTNEDKALSVLNARISDLEKLTKARKADSIMGMPILFGMSKTEVAGKLGLNDLSKLDIKDSDSDQIYKIKLFGEMVPVIFGFMNTSFLPFDNENDKQGFASFLKTLKRELPSGFSGNAEELYTISTLYSVYVSGMERREDFAVLNEELSKKYKRAYPQFSRMATLLEEDGFLAYGKEDEDIADSSHEFFYEDKDRYIVVSGDWGTLTGEFSADYISKAYLDLYIPSTNVLFQNLTIIQSYDDSLVLLPHDASLNELVYAVGNRKLNYVQGPGEYYYIYGEYENNGQNAAVNIYFKPDNKAYAATILYVDSDYPGFEESLLRSLAKKYKKLPSTPDSVENFIGYGSNFDLDFESGQNYIHIGFTPHFATQHELTIIAKKALPDYEKAYKKQQKINTRQKDRHLNEVRRDSEKF